MIGPGWLPTRPRTVGLRRRTLPYTRARPRRTPRVTSPPRALDHVVMLFDGARELPTATVHRAPELRGELWLGDLRRWLAARWSFLRPRTVPVLVAALGALALVQSVNYLSHPPPIGTAPALTLDTASAPAQIQLVAHDTP